MWKRYHGLSTPPFPSLLACALSHVLERLHRASFASDPYVTFAASSSLTSKETQRVSASHAAAHSASVAVPTNCSSSFRPTHESLSTWLTLYPGTSLAGVLYQNVESASVCASWDARKFVHVELIAHDARCTRELGSGSKSVPGVGTRISTETHSGSDAHAAAHACAVMES